MSLWLLCCVPCALLLWARSADAHGYLLHPASRNWVAHKEQRFWNEASGNGLGQGNAAAPGVCGDPFQTTTSNFVDEPSPIQATYLQGQQIELKVVLTTNHGGKFSFRVCPRRRNLDEACFGSNYLIRADNGQKDTWIFDMSRDFTMRYKLPPGIACEGGCVLQWDYFSVQSCVEPGCNPEDCRGYSTGDNEVYHSNPGFCSPGRGAKPEFFRNCADIRILPAVAQVTSDIDALTATGNAIAASHSHQMDAARVDDAVHVQAVGGRRMAALH